MIVLWTRHASTKSVQTLAGKLTVALVPSVRSTTTGRSVFAHQVFKAILLSDALKWNASQTMIVDLMRNVTSCPKDATTFVKESHAEPQMQTVRPEITGRLARAPLPCRGMAMFTVV